MCTFKILIWDLPSSHSARRNTSSYQNGRPPKTQSRPPPPDRVPSQHPHNPPKDTPTPSATSRDSQSTRPHNPPPSTLKDTQPTRTPSAPPRDPLPSRPPPTKSKETRLHPAPSREARKTTGQRRENTEGNSTSASNSSQKFRGEKQAKEVKKVPVKPTVSTPTLDSESFPPLPSSKMAPSSNGSEVVIGKETVPLQVSPNKFDPLKFNPVSSFLRSGFFLLCDLTFSCLFRQPLKTSQSTLCRIVLEGALSTCHFTRREPCGRPPHLAAKLQ